MPNNKKIIKQIANSRINYLFQRAHNVYQQNNDLANRYVYLARRYAQRARIKIPIEWRKRICHKCKKFLYPGINCRIRMQSRSGAASHVSVTCFECNKITRYYIKANN